MLRKSVHHILPKRGLSWKLTLKARGEYQIPALPTPKIENFQKKFFNSSTGFLLAQNPKEKSIESIYQRKTPIEHVLDRPDTYVGTNTRIHKKLFVLNGIESILTPSAEKPEQILDKLRIDVKEVAYVPAMYRIIDELLVNAVDNFNRADTGTNTVKIDIDVTTGWIHVFNNGKNVPVTMHQKEKLYVPELVFGYLLTGSNFDDEEVKYTGGRNGYGAKLANIFSKRFVIDIVDGQNKKHYVQEWQDNMSKCLPAKIKDVKSSANHIKVSLLPDYARFGISNIQEEKDFLAILGRRALDLAACNPGLSVHFNGTHLPVKNFNDYVKLIYSGRKQTEGEQKFDDRYVFKKISNSLQIAVGPTVQENEMTHFTFVNSIATVHGGTHLTTIVNQLSKQIKEYIEKNHKDVQVSIQQAHIVSNLSIFMNCMVENPSFDSQTKETLTTKYQQFHAKFELPENFVKELASKTAVIDNIINLSLYKQRKQASKHKRPEKHIVIPKLHDANLAGTSNAKECTLILTEGDSAKALAIAGLSVIGRERFGVFPLKGKLINVRDATKAQLEGNQEVQHLKKILGLENNVEYQVGDSRLRYGKVMLMCDQDHDGSHIKGLVINMFHHFWPSLLQGGFIEEFITPIIKVTKKGKAAKNSVISFFTIPEYEKWKSSIPEDQLSQWSVKYYKGLGTSTSEEAKEYFKNLEKHRIRFKWSGDDDSAAIKLAFSKDQHATASRKAWLSRYEEGTHVDHSKGVMTFSEFIHKELILFSQYDNVRSIPSLVDGLKPSQRKVLYCCFKRNLSHEIKVAQLAGYVSENSAYHHGEQSLHATIVNMAQDFVGSNNIPLLYPSGQFGTRLQGGKDAASARYIFTRLNKLTRLIFPEADDPVLEYQQEEGQKIEPVFYVPIIPMLLVNGAEGMGTGYSTSIPTYNPQEIISNILKLIDGQEMNPMTVWARGYTGTITSQSKKAIINGEIGLDGNKLAITELPIGKWTEDYKEFLDSLCDSEGPVTLKSFTEHHTDAKVKFELNLAKAEEATIKQTLKANDNNTNWLREQLIKYFKLESSISLSNMFAFNNESQLVKYDDPLEFIKAYYPIRLEFYEKRKKYMLDTLQAEMNLLHNKLKFLQAIVDGSLQVARQKKEQIIVKLKALGIQPNAAKQSSDQQAEEAEVEESDQDAKAFKGYDYLLNIPIWGLTAENVSQVEKLYKEKKQMHARIASTDTKQMWKEDLLKLQKALETGKFVV